MKSKWLVLFAVVLFMGIGSEAFAKEEVWKDKNEGQCPVKYKIVSL